MGFQALLNCSVIIATWRRVSVLRDTLESLTHQSHPDFEVIVVCDGEDDSTRSFAVEFRPPYLVKWLFHAQNLGLAAGRNTGARAADGDILLFLDDDTGASDDLIMRHIGHHQAVSVSRRLAVAGRIIEDRQSPTVSPMDRFLQEAWECVHPSIESQYALTGVESVGDDFERSVLFGLNRSVRRDVFFSNGGFDERFRDSCEDVEFGERLHLAGVEFVFEPLAIVHHRRNTRDMTGYFRRFWSFDGKVDVQRVFELGQRNAQTERLASMYHGYWLDQMQARLCWHGAGALETLSRGLEKRINLTGSHFLFGPWMRICHAADYWSRVKAEGCTPARLKDIAGVSRQALMFHSISEPQRPDEDSYYIRAGRFHRLMHWLQLTGYKSADAGGWLREETPPDHVLLTFDDAYDDLFDELLPDVIRFHLKPLIFVVADRVGATNLWDSERGLRSRKVMTLAQLREMQGHGVEFGSHTLTHPWLPGLPDADLQREVGDSKHRLEDMIGREVTCFAYPYGGVDRRVRAAVADAGYSFAFSTIPGPNWWSDPLCLRRANMCEEDTFLDLVVKAHTGYGAREWLGLRLRALERELPAQGLRNTVRGVRKTGGRIWNLLPRSRG
jgi:GT2 family glycosyltransferase/peptidoglycan/xylan/chitin deacetylase (PgdA/CDA1 family)